MAANINQSAEDITQQVLDINKKYVQKGIGLIGKLTESSATDKIANINQDTLVGIFTGLVKLNLEYYSKVMDFGFEVTNQLLSSSKSESTESSFTVSGNVQPGPSVELSFVLDNTKNENVLCQLESTSFLDATSQQESNDISVLFSPQSLELQPGASAQILIICSAGKQIVPGTYYSYAKVTGFEPAYFTIVLTIEKNTRTNASQKTTVRKRTAK